MMVKKMNFITIKQLAIILGCTEEAIRQRIRQGKIKCIKVLNQKAMFPEHIRESFPEELAEKIIEDAKNQGLLY